MLSSSKHEADGAFRRTFAVLSVVIGVGPLAVDTSLPAVSDMATGLGTDMGTVQATLGAYAAGVAAGQLIFGTLSDRFGRRPTMILGLVTYVGAAVAVALTRTIEPVMVLRFIQGLGGAAVFVTSRAVVRDQFDVATAARMYANLFLITCIFPVICPIVAGELIQAFGWRAAYLFMAVIAGIGLIIITTGLRESIVTKDRNAFRPRQIGLSFVEVMRDPAFRGHLVLGMGTFVALMTLIGALPAVIVGHLGGTPASVGYLYAVVMTVHLAAAAVGGWLIRRLGIAKMIASGVAILGLAVVVTVIVAGAGWVTSTSFVMVNALVMVGFAFINPSMTAGALANLHHVAGRAAAVLGFLQQGTGALTLLLLGLAIDGSPRPHAVGMTCAGIVTVGAYLLMVRPLKLKRA